jgi:hypothetical protein
LPHVAHQAPLVSKQLSMRWICFRMEKEDLE